MCVCVVQLIECFPGIHGSSWFKPNMVVYTCNSRIGEYKQEGQKFTIVFLFLIMQLLAGVLNSFPGGSTGMAGLV